MADTSPTISIIVPTLNAGGIIKECLKQLLAQTERPLEIIVVDNGSTDNTRAEIEAAAAVDSRVKYCFEPKRSRGAARNTGVLAAQGSIIVSTNADCSFHPDWLERLIAPLLAGQESAAMGRSGYSQKTYWSRQAEKANERFDQRHIKNGYCTSTLDTKNLAIDARLIKSVGFRPEMVAFCDLDLFLRLTGKARIKFVPEAILTDNGAGSFKGTIKTNFERAFWAFKLYREFAPHGLTENNILFESISVRNLLLSPLWLARLWLSNPPGYSFYITVTDLAWRCGLLYFWLSN